MNKTTQIIIGLAAVLLAPAASAHSWIQVDLNGDSPWAACQNSAGVTADTPFGSDGYHSGVTVGSDDYDFCVVVGVDYRDPVPELLFES